VIDVDVLIHDSMCVQAVARQLSQKRPHEIHLPRLVRGVMIGTHHTDYHTNGLTMRPPVPPFTFEDAVLKVRAAEDAWNTRDPERVSLAYSEDSRWRNRADFVTGRAEIVTFLTAKWEREAEYRLIKEIWAHGTDRIGVRFAYEWHDHDEQWFRSYGNENWLFDAEGLMTQRHASINDVPIAESDRKFHWDRSDPRPAEHPGLTELGL
jgi:uncharacterized protein